MSKTVFAFVIWAILPFSIWAFGAGEETAEEDAIESPRTDRQENSLMEMVGSGDLAGVERLLKVDINLNAADASGRTALHAAAIAGDDEIAAILIVRGAQVDPKDDRGRTPLYLAVESGHTDVVRTLVAAGADFAVADDAGQSPASLALDGPADRLSALVSAETVDFPAINGVPLLHMASRRGRAAHVAILLESGADTRIRDSLGRHALDAALDGIVRVEQAGCARLLLEAGSPPPTDPAWSYIQQPLRTGNLDYRFDYGSTALHVAAERGHEGMLRYLLENGADREARDQPGNTALHVAVRKGYRSIAAILMDLGSDVNVRDYNGNAPIHESLTASDDQAMMKMLLDRGADPNLKNESGSTPLHLCVLLDADAAAARLLLDHNAMVDPRDRTGNTPLLLAVENADRELAELLLSEGADIFARNNKGLTPASGALSFGSVITGWFFTGNRLTETDNEGRGPLHLAVSLDSEPETLEVLLRAGADSNLRDFNGETPLHQAVKRGDVPQSRMLLGYGADPFLENNSGRTPLIQAYDQGAALTIAILDGRLETTDRRGNTPLFHAVVWEYPEIVDALLAAGSDASAKNRQKITALHEAVHGENAGIVESLLDSGAPVNSADDMGRTPLHDAVTWGRFDLVRLLVDRGADTDAADLTGQTTLHMSAFAGNDAVSAWLLDSGADPNVRDNEGRTPLFIAAESDRTETVRLLLSRDASLRVRDADGRTPLHIAIAAGRIESAAYLIAAGSDFFAIDASGNTPFHLAMNGGRSLLNALLDEDLANRQDNRGNTSLHIAVESGAGTDIIEILLKNGADRRIRNAAGRTPGELAASKGLEDISAILR